MSTMTLSAVLAVVTLSAFGLMMWLETTKTPYPRLSKFLMGVGLGAGTCGLLLTNVGLPD